MQGDARRRQEVPGGARRRQEAPGGARRCQEAPGGARESLWHSWLLSRRRRREAPLVPCDSRPLACDAGTAKAAKSAKTSFLHYVLRRDLAPPSARVLRWL